MSSLFFRFSQRLLRGTHRDTLINLDILSIPRRNANVKSFLHFFYGTDLAWGEVMQKTYQLVWYGFCKPRRGSEASEKALRASEVSGKMLGKIGAKSR